MSKQQMKGGKGVRVFFSKLNPILSKRPLGRICVGSLMIWPCLDLSKCESETPISGMRRGAETGSFVGQEEIIG
ncbi:hypothetical protein V2J09_011416 [Rumex salicifolius]